MTGLIDRISALVGEEGVRATDFVHKTFRDRMAQHGHFGRSTIETLAEVCREHPNLVGIGVGFLVERLLVDERRRHDLAHSSGLADRTAAPSILPGSTQAKPPAGKRGGPHSLMHLKPMKVAFEVFGSLLLLKFGLMASRVFRRKSTHQDWLHDVAQIRAISAALAAYNLASALRSARPSALRNGAIGFFATNALKPLFRAAKAPP